MSYNIELQSNNTELQEILDAVNALPDAGSSGVELPGLSSPGSSAELLTGYQLIGQDGQIVDGGMVNNGAISQTMDGINTKSVDIPEGYTSGGTVALDDTIDNEVDTQTDLISQIKTSLNGKGVVEEVELATPTISINATGMVVASITQEAGYVAGGTKTTKLQQNTQAAQTIVPSTADQTISAYQYLTGKQTIKGDANLIPENIVSGVSIFGVEGSAEPGGASGEAEVLIRILTGTLTEYSAPDSITNLRSHLFYSFLEMVSLSLPKVTYLAASLCYGCTSLANVYVPSVLSTAGYVFYGCTSLTEIEFPSLTLIGTNVFVNCTALKTVDFHKRLNQLPNNEFLNCSSLTALILRGETLTPLATINTFNGSGIAAGTGYIYVPASLIDTYKAASNWSALASQIRAIEEYPEITGG